MTIFGSDPERIREECADNIVGFFEIHGFVFLSSRNSLRTGYIALITRIPAFVKKVSYNV